MQIVRGRIAVALILACLSPLLPLVTSLPAAAFQVGRSPDFTGCNIWYNDQGQPLRNKIGREIGQEAPCSPQAVRHDSYKVFAGEAAGTLIIQDESHQLECVLSLVPGSKTVVAPTSCRPWKP